MEEKKLEILVVEDNPRHAQAALDLLKDYNVVLVDNYDDAIAKILEANPFYNLKMQRDKIQNLFGHFSKGTQEREELEQRYKTLGLAMKEELVSPSASKYDVLLTDLMFAKGTDKCLAKDDLIHQELAYGFPVAITAANKGIPYIAVVTDMNHHQHPMAYAFDFLKKPNRYQPSRMKINDATVMFFSTDDIKSLYRQEDGTLARNYVKNQSVKNWKAVLSKIMEK